MTESDDREIVMTASCNREGHDRESYDRER